MAAQIAIHHETVYRYKRAISLGPHMIRLRPAPQCRTPIRRYALRIEPTPEHLHWQQDPQGNHVARVVCGKKLRRFAIVVDLVVELIPINPFDFFVEESASSWPFRYEPWLIEELGPSLNAQVRGPRLDAWLAAVPQEETPTIELLVELNRRLARDVAYVRRMEPGVQPPDETLRMALGSCRDSAWLLVQILRRLGIAARFVSGYLVQLASESAAAGDGPEADMADLHAWAEAFIPGAGWIGLDPTSGLLAGEGHLPLAGAATPDSVAPVIGSHEPTDTSLEHTITVKRLALDATAVE